MKKRIANSYHLLWALILIVILIGPAAMAAEDKPKDQAKPEEPAFKPYHTIVDIGLVADIVDQKTVGMVVDSRPKAKKFDEGHIPGALNIPASQFDKMQGLLPADKNALLVFYCDGVKCALSHKSAYLAEALGYKNIKVFSEGYPKWKEVRGAGPGMEAKKAAPAASSTKKLKAGPTEGSIDFTEFENLVKNKLDSVIIIDTRDAGEFAKGSLKTALNIATDQLEKKLPEFKADKPIIYICGTGARSGEAYYMTRDKRKDLAEVYYVDGEMSFDGKGGYKLSPPK